MIGSVSSEASSKGNDFLHSISSIFNGGSEATIIYVLVLVVILYFLTNSILRLFSIFMVVAVVVCGYLFFTNQITLGDITTFFDTVFTRLGLKDLFNNLVGSGSGSSPGGSSGNLDIVGFAKDIVKDINSFISNLLGRK